MKPFHSSARSAPARAIPSALAALCLLVPATAQGEGMPPTSSLEVVHEGATMENRIGTRLDASLEFVDERGYPFKLQQLFPGEKPVILVPGYYSCPAMCGQVTEGMIAALNEIDLAPGADYLIVNVSIDPRETPEVATNRKRNFLHRLTRIGGEEGWRFLTGAEPAIRSLTQQVGFRYFWAEHDNQFAHPPALLFVTPKGELSRVITGTFFDPGAVRLAIVEASEGKLGTFWDRVRLNCLTFDPVSKTYSLAAMTVMRIGGAITVAALALMIFLMIRREKRKTATASATA